jgi:Xaa-Pro aminopeptidase
MRKLLLGGRAISRLGLCSSDAGGKVHEMNPPFEARRRFVLDAISPGAMLILSAPVMVRNNDVEHEYRQDSDFYYLTGFDEPECALLLKSGPEPKTIAFVRERDPERETWDGPRVGVERAVQYLGVDEAFPISALSEKLADALTGCEHLYFPIGQNSAADELVISTLRRLRLTIRRGGVWPTTITEPGTILHEMRLHKDDGELAALRRAIEVTGQAHRAVFATTHAGQWEYEIEAVLRSEFRRSGAERVAYSPIVASGVNATILHHRSNNRQSEHGELILVDAGCEFGYQSADITRTFPASGRFTPLQRAAYEIVLAAQEKAIEEVKPNATMDTVHDVAARELVAGLIELGIVKDDLETSISSGSYKKYYMHRTSHWLGMDVHDVGKYHVSGKPRAFVPNMVLTVEPGLYFPISDEAVPEELRGTGIRIEDDILVTATGFSNLSQDIPKAPDEIESIMSEGQGR